LKGLKIDVAALTVYVGLAEGVNVDGKAEGASEGGVRVCQ